MLVWKLSIATMLPVVNLLRASRLENCAHKGLSLSGLAFQRDTSSNTHNRTLGSAKLILDLSYNIGVLVFSLSLSSQVW